MLSITILMENTVRRRGLAAEHGLSYWIDSPDGCLLFDAGASFAWRDNARALGIDPGLAQAVILSHGHYDHGDGLAAFPFRENGPRLIAHPAAFHPKFSVSDSHSTTGRAIGLSWTPEQITGLSGNIVYNEKTWRIGDTVHVLADIPRTNEFEPSPVGFEYEADGIRQPDIMQDEQVVVLETAKGLVVLLGCSHPGVVNCVKRVQQEFPGKPLHAVIGGTHLEHAGQERIERTIAFFQGQDIPVIVPLHCTGSKVQCLMRQALGDRVLSCGVGDRLEF